MVGMYQAVSPLNGPSWRPPPGLLCRGLQVFAVLQWVFSFLGLAQVCLVALLLAMLGPTWIFMVFYLVWLYQDRDTPRAGGRRSAWVCHAIWRHFRDCFPITLVKTAELDPSRNYLSGFHPHGVLVVGAFANFCTEATGFSSLFPGLRPHLLMLPCWFHMPLFRDYIMTSGLVSSDKASIAYLLSHSGGGQVAILALRGPLEALEAKPGALSLRIWIQKEFVKLALEHGASLVPVFSFGENDLFQQVPNPTGSWVRRVQEALQPLLSMALPLFHGRLGLLLPFRAPMHTVGEPGSPVFPPRNGWPQVRPAAGLCGCRYPRATMPSRLTQLLEDHKMRYGVPADQHLVLL
ncbi:LOW QUALITY PROTEIN: 2-acylglycerol O-acyltransferase 3 [Ctenodactylus gundi]